MPGPRRTLAAAVCAAVVGLFLVAGVGVAQAAPAHRATSVHTSVSTVHVAHVKATGDHAHPLHLDHWALPPETALAPQQAGRASVDTTATSVAPARATRPTVRGPPVAA